MTDDRPRPKYGEYAPIGSVPPAAAPDPIVAQTSAKAAPSTSDSLPKRRTWDVALTTALMIAGVLDVVGSFSRFGNLAATLREVYAQQGLGTFTNDALANDMGVAINVVRVVLLVAAIGLGLWRLGQNKIAFWIPLAAGVLAIIVVTVCLLVVVVSDPALAEYVAQQSTAP
ncbi:DUF6264 family protein [Salinibacterium sp. G-O1]|uniref:DUF6264 family protein n=1 Tax=Salinibacterium sp. G-O1 TaxID=3046208 RepID=UPI0024B9E981|nr:DUF6264 family protein [Salinibacterium sp. G-O1]MDJ0334440.1 DUF6264 family protein [Salinibacterium sp. G-O1]